jgi:hypothetical protein
MTYNDYTQVSWLVILYWLYPYDWEENSSQQTTQLRIGRWSAGFSISWPNRFQGFVANVPRSPNHHVFSRPVLVGIIRKNLWYNLCTNQAFKHHFSSWFSASLWGIVGPIWNALEKSSSWSRVKPDAIACLIILTKHLGIKTSSHCYNVGPPFSISKLEKIYPVTLVNECLWYL